MRTRLLRLSVLFLLCLAVNPALAQRLKSMQIDESFVVTPFGPRNVVNGKQTYGTLALHKVVNVNGKTFICGGIYNFPILSTHWRKFIQRAAVIASDGTQIKKGLTRLSIDLSTNEQHAIRRMRTDLSKPLPVDARKKLARSYDVTADPRHFLCQTVKCAGSSRKWRPVFSDGRSFVTFPSRILVRVPDEGLVTGFHWKRSCFESFFYSSQSDRDRQYHGSGRAFEQTGELQYVCNYSLTRSEEILRMTQ